MKKALFMTPLVTALTLVSFLWAPAASAAAPTPLAEFTALQQTANKSQLTSLSNSSWVGGLVFAAGPNMGKHEAVTFQYTADHRLTTTANGEAGSYTGTGYWLQIGRSFVNAFREPIAGTSLEVIVFEQGTVAADGQSYTATGYGQLYDTSSGVPVPVPNSSGVTQTTVARQ